MLYKKNTHIMYCSNIFKKDSWKELIKNINKYSKIIKKKYPYKRKIAIGLCLSNKMANLLINKKKLKKFKNLINKKNIYVPSINGFVYKKFHQKMIKDKIYIPDWSSKKRIKYTNKLIKIINELNKTGSISTLPISYKKWIKKGKESYILYQSSINILKSIKNIIKTKNNIHIDIEPEPGCLIENSKECINLFKNWIKPISKTLIPKNINIKNKLGICYDICHLSVNFEKHNKVIENFKKNNIKIGKIQISSSIKIKFNNKNKIKNINKLKLIKESPFLHQTIIKSNKKLIYKSDIKEAIKSNIKKKQEWRIHYHIPIYKKKAMKFKTTQKETIKLIEHIKNNKITKYLEIETYTYNKKNIFKCIIKELEWLNRVLKK